ncbi:MAG TPA: hypothetical protein VGM90_16160 [Kofleriaceae bacterium]|jgi:hypothetical protein
MNKLAFALLGVLASVGVANADEDPGMAVMQLMLKSPGLSKDGKHVAMYSMDPSKEKDTATSLIVFSAAGKEEKRIGVVPPNTDAKRTMKAVDAINKLQTAGGYTRMSRVASVSEKNDKGTYTTDLTSEDVAITVSLAKDTVVISGTRGDAKLAAVKLPLGKAHGTCASVDSWGVVNTMSGYDKTKKLFAFALQGSHGDDVCSEYDFVVTLK